MQQAGRQRQAGMLAGIIGQQHTGWQAAAVVAGRQAGRQAEQQHLGTGDLMAAWLHIRLADWLAGWRRCTELYLTPVCILPALSPPLPAALPGALHSVHAAVCLPPPRRLPGCV